MDKNYDIFISHSKEDGKIALALCHFLEERKLRCWIAPRDVQAGKNYAKCIIEGIQSSSIMIVILSEYSNRSNHVRTEVERAFNHQVAIMPFRIKDVIPAESLEYFLSSYHWLDAIDGQAENYFDELYRHCAALLKPDQPAEPPKPPKPIDIPKPPFKDKPDPPYKKTQVDPLNSKAKIYIAGAIVVAILLFIITRPLFDKNVIEFKNNAPSAIYFNVDGKTDTIALLSSFKYKGRKNSRITTKAYTYVNNTKGELIGRRIEWTIDTVVHADGDFTYPMYINNNYFFLKIINNSDADINYVRVNGNDQSERFVLNIKIPNDGRTYNMGYYKILSGSSVEIWNRNNHYLKWTNGDGLGFTTDYNQQQVLSYR